MVTELTANNIITTVSSGGTTAPAALSSESWTVAASSGWPAAVTGSSQFRVVDTADTFQPPEIMLVTNVASTTWTVTRGYEGATPWAHTAGFSVMPVLSSGGLANFVAINGLYGDGSDGTVTFDGTTTILGIVPSSSIYTLARDILLAAGTINNGVTIIANGFRIFCTGTLTNNGTIQWNGGAGGNGTTSGGSSGVSVGNAGSSINSSANIGKAGTVGGTAGGGGTGSASSNSYGGSGGHGGAGSSGAGSVGGAATTPNAQFGSMRSLPQAGIGALAGGGFWQAVFGGAGGAGGGGDSTNAGGGGGGGGCCVVIVSYLIAGTGAIQARGGIGGNGNTVGNTGGGGGGGGGWVNIVSHSVIGGAIAGQTIDANGGSHGSSHGTGGALITDGTAGTVILVPN